MGKNRKKWGTLGTTCQKMAESGTTQGKNCAGKYPRRGTNEVIALRANEVKL